MDTQSSNDPSPGQAPGPTSQGYDTLTENVLLEIFDLCRGIDDRYYLHRVWKWHTLVQVCRRWRDIIFASPRRLDLRILCTYGTPVRKNLCVWRAIPIVVEYRYDFGGRRNRDDDNVIAALEHPDRVCQIGLDITGSQLRKMAVVMQESFPVLTDLSITSKDKNAPVISSGFLGESAPCLQTIELCGVAFPALPTLLLSASDLVTLRLEKIPLAGYISPETMVAHLATLPRLKTLHIEFRSTPDQADQMFLPPEARTVLPALCYLHLFGVCGYSEDFVARIDAPQLNTISIHYLDQAADFEVPRLSEFIDRSDNLKDTLSSHCQTRIMLDDDSEAGIYFYVGGATNYEAEAHYAERWDPDTGISVGIVCERGDRQILHVTHVLSWISSILSDIVHFAIDSASSIGSEHWSGLVDLDDRQWLDLLRPFSSVQTLVASNQIARFISHALDNIDGVMVTEMLPVLELLCLEDQPLSSIDLFIALRLDSGHPVTPVITKVEFAKRLTYYP